MEQDNKIITEEVETTDFSSMPEGIIAYILSLTTPLDAYRSSAVSRTFLAAADSDIPWEKFLPPDYHDMISRRVLGIDWTAHSKKEAFFKLCDLPLLIDDGNKSCALDRCSGKKCLMLGARDLMIAWGDTPAYWSWEGHRDSRLQSMIGSNPILSSSCLFSPSNLNVNSSTSPLNVIVTNKFTEVAVLLHVWWLEIRGKISCRMLSPATTYAAYFVFKMKRNRYYGFNVDLADATVGIVGGEYHMKNVCLDPHPERPRQPQWDIPRIYGRNVPPLNTAGLQPLRRRTDGWFEIELGEFQNDGGDDEVEVILMEVKGNTIKCGLVVHGIEFRPKINPA